QQQDIAFRLGQTYFEDLKNYQAAAEQFTRVISSGLTGGRFEDALLYRARSYEYLSWREQAFRSRAVESYTTFLKSYHTDPRADEAALSLFELQAASPSAAREALASVTSLYPATRQKGVMLLKTGELEAESDSVRIALRTFERVLKDYPSGETTPEARYGRFAMLSKLGLRDSAMVEGRRYISQNPSGAHASEVLYHLGMEALKAGDAASASGYFSTLVTRFEYSGEAMKGKKELARSYMLQGETERSVALYEKLLAAERANPFQKQIDGDLLLGAADAYRRAGRSGDAQRMLFETMEGGTGRGEAYAALGMLAKEEGDPALAASYFRMSASMNPDATTTREIADLMFESGSYEDAIARYKQLSASDASELNVRYFQSRMIVSMIRAGQLKGAEKEIELFGKRYKDTDLEMGSFELEKGNHYFRNSQYSNARASYAVVMKKYDDTPSVPDAMYWTGKSMEAEGKQDAAAKQYTELIEEYPKAPVVLRAHLGLGNIGYHKEEWDKAVRHYRFVVESPMADDELLPFAMSNLIETYEAAGVYDAALDLARRYLDRYPANEDSFDKQIKIGILYQRLGYHDQSIVHLQGLLDHAGSDLEGEIRYYIAEGNFNKGDFQQAILDFLKVPYLVSKKGKIDWTANSLYMAGQSYERLGRYDQAVSMYKQIIDRSGIDETFKAAAKKEIDRVNLVIKGTK
ncbi:MAG: tetratricopeptide repeat protein, partial [Ignavibacteria bacterium]|nr:tetratricopeptide repeat protein [Ignavibacteria bacterium]